MTADVTGDERIEQDATDPADGRGDSPAVASRSTVDRIVTVLEAVARSDGGVGARSLAREAGIDRSAVSRLLRQLAELGVAAPAAVPGRYTIGPRLFAIAGAISSRDELRAAARPSLEALVARFNETSYLAVLEADRVVYRDLVESTQPLRYVADVGVSAPLHAGAAGRAILAGMADDVFQAWLGRAPLERLTADTVTDPETLRARRAADREAGYSVSRGERVPGGAAVAAPFLDGSGTVRGSLVVTGPAGRLPIHRAREIARVLVSMADQLSQRLGATPGTRGAGPPTG